MKPIILTLVAVLLSPVLFSPVVAQKENQVSDERIAELIKGLDADGFKARENSEQELIRIGKPAVKAVRKAFENSRGEVKSRCRRILKKLVRSIRLVESTTHPDLGFVVSTVISNDGKFLYSSAWKANAVAVFSREKESGKITHLQSLKDPDLAGAVCLRLSQDGKFAAACSFNAKTVTLFERHAESGKLEKKDVYRASPNGKPLNFPTECGFSSDSKFLFVGDSKGMVVLQVSEAKKLTWVETNTGQQSCFNNVRGIAVRPGKNQFYAASSDAGTISTVSWDKDTGKLTVDQVLADEQNGVKGLAGAFSVATSSDGKFLYSSSGRFRGDSAVGAYEIQDDGTLKVIQELISGRDDVGEFVGGNELILSRDNKSVYASATRSSTLAGFSRDAKTGKLKFVETVLVGAPDLGPAGISIDPSGDYIYVAVESASGIAVFKRDEPE